ncbi:unnamed protein product [Adineta ricciae]|uniref:GW182 middle domain-containing protein n=2 Tax=Adineta ricciae TaxID=249248 RepID=A0A814KZ55_ADIRI|nr:unnamed protein product [Adineta ricciae]
MINESHPSPTGSSSSSLFAHDLLLLLYVKLGSGGGAGVNEPLTQPIPAKPTWAQILNSNPNAPSNTSATATSSSSGMNATAKPISPSASGTSNASGTRQGFMPNFYDQPQSQMNWPLNFNQSSSWMINDDESQRQPNSSSQQNAENPKAGGDGFDRVESSSPTSDWNKPVASNNSSANGWSNFQQQQQQQQQTLNNPSRSNPNSNQWPEMNNFYGANASTNSFNLPQQNTDNTSSSTTWQDPSATGNVDPLTLTSALKSAIALSGSGNGELLGGNGDTMISYVPQPKLVEQLGWDEPDINVLKRANFDDGTSIWGDPMELMSVPVKKWTNGTKAALANSTNIIVQQQQQQQTPQIVQKPVSTATTPSATSSQMVLNDENWPKQQSPTMVQQPISQWNDTATPSNMDPPNIAQAQNYRPQQNNWNSHGTDEWFREGVVDTSDWGLQGPPQKAPFDPYKDQIDTSNWAVQSSGGMPGSLPPMPVRNRFPNEYDFAENPHDVRMPAFDNSPHGDPYRQNSDMKTSMGNFPGMMPSSHHPFPPRPGQHYGSQQGNILRPINSNAASSTPSNVMMNQSSHLSPKLPTSSPVPNQAPYVPGSGKSNSIPNPSAQPPTPSQPAGNGSNNGTVHAQIMQQFRLAVQAGLISQDLLNTKLPPNMLQLLQKLFELQQKYQQLTSQLNDLNKNKTRFPMPLLQNEYDRLTKLLAQKKQEMLSVQREIQDAHAKLKQQSMNQTPTPTQMMSNGPVSQNTDQSRLTQWTKQSTIGGPRSSMFPPPPGLGQKDWQTDNSDPNENWDNSQAHESNNANQVGNVDPHGHSSQVSSAAFSDPFSNLVDDIEGPPPFVPGQLWNWKSPLPNIEDDPHVTPSSLTMGPKGSPLPMGNLNVSGAESAFSNPHSMHQYPRQLQSNRSQWQQGSMHDQQGFQSTMNDWGKQQQFRGPSKAPSSHPPPYGNASSYRPYM